MNLEAIAVQDITAAAKDKPQQQGQKRKAPAGPDEPNPAQTDQRVQRLLQNPPTEAPRGADSEGELVRRRLILKLKAYGVAFSEIAGEILKSKNLEDMDTRSLEVLLNEVKFTVGTRTSGIVTSHVSDSFITIGQALLAKNTSLLVEGPAVQLSQVTNNKDYQDLVKEMALEYADWVYQKPENRFLAFMAHTVFTIDSINQDAVNKGAPNPKRLKVEEPPQQPAQPPPTTFTVEELPGAPAPVPPVGPPKPVALGKDAGGFEILADPPRTAKPKPTLRPTALFPKGK